MGRMIAVVFCFALLAGMRIELIDAGGDVIDTKDIRISLVKK